MIPNPFRRLPGARWGVSGALCGLCLGLPLATLVWLTGSPGWNVAALLGAAIYGAARVCRSHPGCRESYRDWLARTPWRWPQPLPYRSPFLSTNDAAFVVVTAGLCSLGLVAGIKLIAAGFALGYVLAVLSAGDDELMSIGSFVLIGGAIAGFVGPDGPSLTSVWVTLLLALGLSQLSLRRGLKRLSAASVDPPKPPSAPRAGAPFHHLLGDATTSAASSNPWKGLTIWLVVMTVCCEVATRRTLAWIAVTDAEAALDFGTTPLGVARTLLYFGGEAYQMYGAAATNPRFIAAAGLALLLPVGLAVLMRFARYAPPISLLGRLATRRFFLPRYDFMWLLPLGVLFVSPLVCGLLLASGFSPVLGLGLGFAAASGLMAWCATAWNDWRLTGHHRIVLGPPPVISKQSANRSKTPRTA